jgi:hypothetical protein
MKALLLGVVVYLHIASHASGMVVLAAFCGHTLSIAGWHTPNAARCKYHSLFYRMTANGFSGTDAVF